MSSSERREFTRSRLRLEARLELPDGGEVRGEASDVSLTGFHCATAARPSPGTPCRIVLLFGEAADGRLELLGEGRVARWDENGLGVEITLLEIESHEHLRNLILYHAEDQERAAREFREHLGLRRWPPGASGPHDD